MGGMWQLQGCGGDVCSEGGPRSFRDLPEHSFCLQDVLTLTVNYSSFLTLPLLPSWDPRKS